MAKRSVPAPFVRKTYELVDDKGSEDVISWNESGTAFVVWKTADFARDLLPAYFNHNNFAAFVRHLNTCGFRKIVPDKWEFANENFRRGEKELLTEIRLRKTVPSPPQLWKAGKSAGVGDSTSPSNSVEDLGSTSTWCTDSKNLGSVNTPAIAKMGDLSDKNKKLKRDNEMLTRKKCDELVPSLARYVKAEPDQINRIMSQGSCVPSRNVLDSEIGDAVNDNCDDDELLGVWLKEKKKKRGRDENLDFSRKEMTMGDFNERWSKLTWSQGEGSN